MKQIIFIFAMLMALPSFARDFEYTYEGQTLTYTVIDEEAKTCKTKEGSLTAYDAASSSYGNFVIGDLTIPEIAKDGEIGYSVISIGTCAFYGCRGLTSVTIPNSVTSIYSYAFQGCSSLTSVTIPESVTSIYSYAFQRCSSLTSVTIPQSVKLIGMKAFFGCTDLTSFTIPESVTTIFPGTFSGCRRLTSVTIPESVTSIDGLDYSFENGAFYGCSSLTSVTIPESVTSIGYYAFYGCSSLTSVTIPKSVTSIGNSAFDGCSSLTSVKIPNSVTSIGKRAFSRCSSLTSIYYSAKNPIVADKSIFSTYYNATLYVPAEAVDKCKSIEPWTFFSNIEAYDFSGIEEVFTEFDSTLPYEVYNLNGVMIGNSIDNLAHGIYIVRQGNAMKKIAVK